MTEKKQEVEKKIDEKTEKEKEELKVPLNTFLVLFSKWIRNNLTNMVPTTKFSFLETN